MRHPANGKHALDGHIDDAESKNNYYIIYPKGDFKDLASAFIYKNEKGRFVYPVLKTVIVQSDKDYFRDKGDAFIWAFFQDVTKCIEEKYGSRDIFLSVVHVDEDNPHMHLCFFPYDSEGREVPVFEEEMGDEISAKVCPRWKLEPAENIDGRQTLTKDEYLHQRQMFLHGIELHNRLEKLQDARTQIREAEELLETREEELRKVNAELRDKNRANDSMTQELKEIRAELLEETELHSFIQTAIAQPDPSKNKDVSNRILKARNALLQQQMAKQQEDAKEVFTRMQTAEGKVKDVEAQNKDLVAKGKDTEAKLREAEQIIDKIRIMYPDIDIEAAKTSKPHTKTKRKDKGSKDNTKAQ